MDPTTEPTEETCAEVWGLGATIVWSVLIAGMFVVLQSLVVIGFGISASFREGEGFSPEVIRSLGQNGWVLSWATVVTTAVCTPLTIVVIGIRKGLPPKEYLGWKAPPFRVLLRWLLATALFLAACDTLTRTLGRPVVPEFVQNAYATARFAPLLWLVLIVAAPLFEEVFVRGFVFTGIQSSRLGPVGAVLLTSFGWSIAHAQYDAYEIGLVFATGILLAMARWRTGSVITPLCMHGFMNLTATLQAAALHQGIL